MPSHLTEVIKEILFRDRDRNAISPLDGPLRPNNLIDCCSVVCSTLREPDDLAIDSNNALYVSTEQRVVRLVGEAHKEQEDFANLPGRTGGLSFHPDGRLMVCVGGQGLALITMDGEITWVESAGGERIICPTAAVAGPQGEIYITDGTTRHKPEEWIWDLMEKNTAGRLIRHLPETGKTEVLLSDMGYPYGVVISHDETALLLSESWRHRLLRYPLKDIRPECAETVIGNMPGYPARITQITQSFDAGYWMCIFAPRNRLVEFVLKEDNYRKHMMREIEPDYWVAPALSSGEDFLEPLQAGGARTLGVIKPWASPRSYGLVIKLDEDFSAVASLHSRVDGKRHGLTGLCYHDGTLYMTSKGHDLVFLADEGVLR